MTRLFSILIFLAIVVFAFLSLKPTGERSTENVTGLPWQIEVLPEGRARVFGVTLGQDTLGQAGLRLGGDAEVAVIVAVGQQSGGLEMFYRRYKAGVFSGKLVLAADLDPAEIERLMAGALKSEYMDTGARKFTLNPDDLPGALRARLSTMTFVPTVKIDEPSARERFGEPAEVVRGDDAVAHLLYPDKGLDLAINDKGRAVLQYVAPRDFEQLRAPLKAPSPQ